MPRRLAKAVAGISILAFATPAQPQDVTISFRGGGLVIVGQLMAADSGSYVVRSDKFGVMALETSKFDCQGAACPKPSNITLAIHGSNTIGAQLLPAVIEAFAEREGYAAEKVVGAKPEEVEYRFATADGKPAATLELQSHGSNTAPPSLIKGKAQIGSMSRPIKQDELKALNDAGFQARTTIFALDGLAVLVSPTNPIKTLTLEQIAKIFAGEIKDWSEVGGNPGPINLYARDAKSGTFDTFDSLVLKPGNRKLSAQAKRFESSADLSDETARDPNGIGFTGFAYIRNARAVSVGSPCGIVSQPDIFSVKTEEYPLSRRLFLYNVDGKLPVMAEKFLSFAVSDQAQGTIAESGFVNQKIDTQSFESQTPRLAPALMVPEKEFRFALMRDLVADLTGATRLSVNFRFSRTSLDFDEKTQLDVARLARVLKTDAFKDKRVYLLGFTDNQAAFDANRTLASARANAIKTALVAEGIDEQLIVAKGYGNLLPVGCNSSEAGRASNRRVEVWVRD
jgi:phosphate transport system substrate-binding protein